MMSLFPAFFLLGAVLALMFYNLDDSTLKEIEEELKRRKIKSASELTGALPSALSNNPTAIGEQ